MEHVKKKRLKWLCVFAGAMIVYLLLVCLIHNLSLPESSFFYPFFNDYGGNITAEILGGFLFLFLAFYINAMSEAKIDEIVDVTRKNESILANREKLLDRERSIDRFEQFLKRESYHNVRFPDLKLDSDQDALGLEYKIEPIRDSKTGEPISKVTEMETLYIVKVIGPAYEKHLEEDELKKYEMSPMRDNEYYFCQFFDGSWQMSQKDVTDKWHKFYLSSKVGPVQWGADANEFISASEKARDDYTILATLHLKDDGTPLIGSGGCTSYKIYQDDKGNLYLRIHKSPLKRMYCTNTEPIIGDEGWSFHIEHMRGCAYGKKLENIKTAILDKLQALHIEPQKVPWHEIKNFSGGA